MRRTLSAALLTLATPWSGSAQTHKVAKPEQVVRAVGVYEWTGDLKKPDGSRLLPITVFIDGALVDASVYLPRPIPFALTPGNEYVLERSGLAQGSLDLAYATHLQTPDSAYEDGWFGYGSYKAPPAPKRDPPLRASRSPAILTSSKDDPHPGSKADPDSTNAKSQTAEDPDRPTMHRSADSSSPDATPTSTSADDPDRPTLRRRSPNDAKKSKGSSKDVATVTGTGSLNDDPDRPRLQHAERSSANDSEIPKLLGLPKNLKQMVAISDASNRPPHDFARSWQDDKERSAVLARMRDLAQAQLKLYSVNPTPPPPSTPSPTSPKSIHPARATAASRSAAAHRHATPAEPSLLEEQLNGYTLSYGGAPTYVYTAQTSGAGPDLRYVTVVAQADVNGALQPAVRSVTDEAHLDRAPRMRLVDVVDAEASNRASLLFELRAHTTRQFALYRVIGSRAETTFTTGTTQ